MTQSIIEKNLYDTYMQLTDADMDYEEYIMLCCSGIPNNKELENMNSTDCKVNNDTYRFSITNYKQSFENQINRQCIL
jgi:CRISPR/Cas system CSM-associated protein Csm4 (group 5 of RAMP superfamily)